MLKIRGDRFHTFTRHPVGDYVVVVIGSLITALALNWFLIPNKIAAGGVSGLATVFHHLFGLPVGLTMLFINVPLFFISLKVLGPRFGMKTALGAVVTSVFVDVLALFVTPLTTDAALSAIYGGLLAGVGIGLTFRAGGSTGGTDLLAALLNHYTKQSLGRMLLVADGVVILAAGLVFGPELALYAFLSVYLSSRAIDFVQEGGTFAKAAFVISAENDRISELVLQVMERGVTQLQGQGMFTGEDRPMLFVIVSRSELTLLRQIVASVDPYAFMVVADVSEVLGEGFGPLGGYADGDDMV